VGFSSVFDVLFFPMAVQKWGFIMGFGATLLGVAVIWAGDFLRGTLFGLKWQDLAGNADQSEDKSSVRSNK